MFKNYPNYDKTDKIRGRRKVRDITSRKLETYVRETNNVFCHRNVVDAGRNIVLLKHSPIDSGKGHKITQLELHYFCRFNH